MKRGCFGLPWSLVASALLFASAQAQGPNATGICSSMDIRNKADQFSRLKGCRVIEGQLNIVLFEHTSHKTFEKMSFPELREVTGYILIYRIKGLRNLGDLFPNLTVVRGMQLYKDFALVVFDNEDLGALGLRSLTKIERGGIRIQNNDRLCYINTIDWSRIMGNDVDNIIRSNYDTRLCGLCPNAETQVEGLQSSQRTSPADSSGKTFCWDDKHCQKICSRECGDHGCMPNGSCCHSACLGGCDGPSPHNCIVCKRFSFLTGVNRTCVDSCPAGTYELFRRCVSEEECRKMTPPPQSDAEDSDSSRYTPSIRTYKIHKNKCVDVCPTGYMEAGEFGKATCVPCPSTGCVRECIAKKIDSFTAAELYRGCTILKGNVEIVLRSGGNTISALESSLGEVLEIHGSLQVSRSHSLVSLMFFKKLKRIVGTGGPEYKGTVLHIHSNNNLELLWDWSSHEPIEISGGKLNIYSNPKLCYNQLLPLLNMTKNSKSNFTEAEVSQESNGYQASCLPDDLQMTVFELWQNFVILTWNAYCPEDMRQLLGYSLYYIATENNVTLYDKRDACFDTWTVIDVPLEDTYNSSGRNIEPANKSKSKQENPSYDICGNLQPKFHLIDNLIPYTRYAAYVKTYTTVQDKRGAQSAIMYFRTLPGNPSPPTSVSVEYRSPHSVYIKWSPPTMSNGTIKLYHVEIQANSYNQRMIMERNINYCTNPSALVHLIKGTVEEAAETQEGKSTGDVKNGSCACKEEMKPSTRFNLRVEEDRMETISFENELQNQIYRKTAKTKLKQAEKNNRRKRSVDSNDQNNKLVKLTENNNPEPGRIYSNATDDKNYVKALYYELEGKTLAITVENMRHFTWYTVYIWACRNQDVNETTENYTKFWCSQRSYHTFRTLPMPNADIVNNFQVDILPSNKTVPEVNVTWSPPINPNGFIVAYNVYYSPVDENSQGQDMSLQSCIKANDYETNGHSYILRNLSPGNYSINVTPISVSGAGNVSADAYVFIPKRSTELSYELVWGIVGGCLIIFLMVGGGVWYGCRGLMSPTEASKLFASVNPEYASAIYVPDEWEVPRENIEFIRELGQGSFGMVYEGIVKGIEKSKPEIQTRCAVKTVNEHATDRERIEFLNEASVMKAFDTFHVVRLLGVVSRGQPTLVIMELMEHGDLKSYLRSHRPETDGSLPKKDKSNTPPTLQNILQMAIEIADGMAYLSAKKFVHRDLAARNCMVAGDLTVKVGDFGMTRDIYETDYYRKGSKGLLPVRWMSPESLKDGVFSSNSDVWSYGVVIWEMATLAMQPYQGLSNEQVLRYVVEGGLMERPEHCPDQLYDLMRTCWEHRAHQRPSFLRLVAQLTPHADSRFRHRSFFHSPLGQEMYALQRSNIDEEQEMPEVNVGAVATGSGSNLFGVSGRLASWVRELSSLRSHVSDDAAAEALQPLKGPNGVVRERSDILTGP